MRLLLVAALLLLLFHMGTARRPERILGATECHRTVVHSASPAGDTTKYFVTFLAVSFDQPLYVHGSRSLEHIYHHGKTEDIDVSLRGRVHLEQGATILSRSFQRTSMVDFLTGPADSSFSSLLRMALSSHTQAPLPNHLTAVVVSPTPFEENTYVIAVEPNVLSNFHGESIDERFEVQCSDGKSSEHIVYVENEMSPLLLEKSSERKVNDVAQESNTNDDKDEQDDDDALLSLLQVQEEEESIPHFFDERNPNEWLDPTFLAFVQETDMPFIGPGAKPWKGTDIDPYTKLPWNATARIREVDPGDLIDPSTGLPWKVEGKPTGYTKEQLPANYKPNEQRFKPFATAEAVGTMGQAAKQPPRNVRMEATDVRLRKALEGALAANKDPDSAGAQVGAIDNTLGIATLADKKPLETLPPLEDTGDAFQPPESKVMDQEEQEIYEDAKTIDFPGVNVPKVNGKKPRKQNLQTKQPRGGGSNPGPGGPLPPPRLPGKMGPLGPPGPPSISISNPFDWCDLHDPFQNPFCPLPGIPFLLFNLMIKCIVPGIIGPIIDNLSEEFMGGQQTPLDLVDQILLQTSSSSDPATQAFFKSTMNPFIKSSPTSREALADALGIKSMKQATGNTLATRVRQTMHNFPDLFQHMEAIKPASQTTDKNKAQAQKMNDAAIKAHVERDLEDMVKEISESPADKEKKRRASKDKKKTHRDPADFDNFEAENKYWSNLDRRLSAYFKTKTGIDLSVESHAVVEDLKSRDFKPKSLLESDRIPLRIAFDEEVSVAMHGHRYPRPTTPDNSVTEARIKAPPPPQIGVALIPALKMGLYNALVHPLTSMFADILTRELTAAATPLLFDALVDDLKEFLRMTLTHSLTHTLGNTLPLTLGTTVPDTLEKALPVHLITELTGSLTHTITRGVSHAVGATLVQTLGKSNRAEYFCYYCHESNEFCDECKASETDTDTYAALHYTTWLASYYSDYFAPMYATDVFKIMLET